MSDNTNKNKIKNLSDKSNNNEVYEQMEIDNLDIKIIQKKKNSGKSSSVEIKELIKIVICIIYLFLSFMLFFYSIKKRIDRYGTNKKITLN